MCRNQSSTRLILLLRKSQSRIVKRLYRSLRLEGRRIFTMSLRRSLRAKMLLIRGWHQLNQIRCPRPSPGPTLLRLPLTTLLVAHLACLT
jgi:hypothetical protein